MELWRKHSYGKSFGAKPRRLVLAVTNCMTCVTGKTVTNCMASVTGKTQESFSFLRQLLAKFSLTLPKKTGAKLRRLVLAVTNCVASVTGKTRESFGSLRQLLAKFSLTLPRLFNYLLFLGQEFLELEKIGS